MTPAKMANVKSDDLYEAAILAGQLKMARQGNGPETIYWFVIIFGIVTMATFWFGDWEEGMLGIAMVVAFPAFSMLDARNKRRKSWEIEARLRALGASCDEIDAIR